MCTKQRDWPNFVSEDGAELDDYRRRHYNWDGKLQVAVAKEPQELEQHNSALELGMIETRGASWTVGSDAALGSGVRMLHKNAQMELWAPILPHPPQALRSAVPLPDSDWCRSPHSSTFPTMPIVPPS